MVALRDLDLNQGSQGSKLNALTTEVSSYPLYSSNWYDDEMDEITKKAPIAIPTYSSWLLRQIFHQITYVLFRFCFGAKETVNPSFLCYPGLGARLSIGHDGLRFWHLLSFDWREFPISIRKRSSMGWRYPRQIKSYSQHLLCSYSLADEKPINFSPPLFFSNEKTIHQTIGCQITNLLSDWSIGGRITLTDRLIRELSGYWMLQCSWYRCKFGMWHGFLFGGIFLTLLFGIHLLNHVSDGHMGCTPFTLLLPKDGCNTIIPMSGKTGNRVYWQ